MNATAVRGIVRALDTSGLFPIPPGELSLVFLGERAMTRLHADYLADATPTDVITFDGDPLFGAAGEVCVCADVAQAYARDNQLDFSRELTLYVVHGCLHLAGFDDTTPLKRRGMRAAERRAMGVLDSLNAIPRFSLA